MSFIEAPIFIGKSQKIKHMPFVFQKFQNQCDYFLFFGHRLVAHRRVTKKFKKSLIYIYQKMDYTFGLRDKSLENFWFFKKKRDKIVTKCDN